MPIPKKKSTKKTKKLKLTKNQLAMAQRYEKAWHELYYKKPRGIQKEIIDNPHGRTAIGFAHDVAKLAEVWEYDDKK